MKHKITKPQHANFLFLLGILKMFTTPLIEFTHRLGHTVACDQTISNLTFITKSCKHVRQLLSNTTQKKKKTP